MKNKLLLIIFMCSTIYAKVPFEKYFKKYSEYYFKHDNIDYYWFVAQAKQESRFDSLAVSYVGASGIMQIMPLTWKDLTNNIFNVQSPKYNIKYGIKYDKKMWNIYKAPRPKIDRISFMFGSYNAGAGNIIKSQKKAQNQGLNPNIWTSIKQTLYLITGNHSKETLTYVKRIKKYYKQYNVKH